MPGSEIGRLTYEGSNQASRAITLAAGAAVGTTVVVAVNAPSAAGAITTHSAVDSKGNTWTYEQGPVINGNANNQIGVLKCVVTTALLTSDTITVTCNTRSPAIWCMIAIKFTDAGAKDATASGTATGTSTTPGVTAGTASQNAQIEFFVYTWATTGSTGTLTGTWDGTPSQVTSGATTPKNMIAGWRYLNASGTRSAAGSYSGGGTVAWAAALLTLNQLSSGSTTRKVKKESDGTWQASIGTKRKVSGSWV